MVEIICSADIDKTRNKDTPSTYVLVHTRNNSYGSLQAARGLGKNIEPSKARDCLLSFKKVLETKIGRTLPAQTAIEGLNRSDDSFTVEVPTRDLKQKSLQTIVANICSEVDIESFAAPAKYPRKTTKPTVIAC